MLQRWMLALFSYPGYVAVLLGMITVLLGLYVWSATEVRRSRDRRMQEIRDTLYISTTLLGQLTAKEHRNVDLTEHEHHELLSAMLSCRAAVHLSPQLQDQIRSCIIDVDPARLALMHRALERESAALSDELNRYAHPDHWGRAIWNVIRPAAEPAAVVAVLYLIADFVFRQQGLLYPFWHSWSNALPWIRFVSLIITVFYGYLLWSSPRQGSSGTVTKALFTLIAMCSLLHLIGLAAAPYALGLQLILFISGFSLTGAPSRSDRPYAGHTDSDKELNHSTEAHEDENLDVELNLYKPRTSGAISEK
ncbi:MULTISPECIES: hypothetical protein [unclassified Paenibacillus]|uniref:hypothetical protein n=1 Tax=unclassified Paenibacillus TaxID=185978 RepID=UPI0008B07D60|nr:hypothetical protein [Paenibacillus sp. OK076]SEO96993.1 hypothetical protein SAMN05518670_5269 [Paenibacillus sp. OK076]